MNQKIIVDIHFSQDIDVIVSVLFNGPYFLFQKCVVLDLIV